MLATTAAGSGGALPGILTKSGYAKHRGCSPAYISKLIRQGKLTAPALREDGLIDVALADAQLAGQADPARAGASAMIAPTAASTVPSFAAAKARRESAQAELAEIELAQKRGELVDRKSVFDTGFDLGALVRDRHNARRRELAQRLASVTDVNEIVALLEEADRKLYEGLTHDIQRRLDALVADDAAAA